MSVTVDQATYDALADPSLGTTGRPDLVTVELNDEVVARRIEQKLGPAQPRGFKDWMP
ncbi:MAG: hypothetical protein ACYSVY_27940 [Planctomycetota bacterium]